MELVGTFNLETAKQFKDAFDQARKTKTGSDTFIFQGHEFLIDYAKYVIQYFKIRFGNELS